MAGIEPLRPPVDGVLIREPSFQPNTRRQKRWGWSSDRTGLGERSAQSGTSRGRGYRGGMADDVLYYGDNLDVLRRHIKDETVDLVVEELLGGNDMDYLPQDG